MIGSAEGSGGEERGWMLTQSFLQSRYCNREKSSASVHRDHD